MRKQFLLLPLFIASFLQISFSQTHDSHQIYNHVQTIKGAFENNPTALFSANRNEAIPSDAAKYVTKADYLVLEESYVEEIKNKRPETLLLEIPVEGQTQQVQLYKKEVTTPTYMVKAASGATTQKSKSVFYRGIVKDEKKSFVSLSVLSNSIHMTISNNSINYEINKVSDKLYAAYRISDSKRTQDTGCAADELLGNNKVKIKKDKSTRATGACIEIYIECDFNSFQDNGFSIQNTEDWALAIMNEVGILYENEGIPMVVSDLLIYDVADPYLAGSDAGEMLSIMPDVILNYDGRLAHVFSTRSVGGGIAWVDVLCAQNNGFSGPFAVSGSMNTSTIPFPIYSWNVNVVAHELGHNIGSRHTHACVWNGNNTQIDDCGSVWGDVEPCYDASNPILPSSGTIMSYCHLVGSVGINFSNGFGPQPGALLLNEYLGASCATGEDCSGSGGLPPVADFTFIQINPCAPSEVQFTDLSTESPTSYEWTLPGATPNFSTEQNPFVVYNEPGFFDVTLMVSNSDGSDNLTLIQVIEVVETPVPDFEYEIEGESISFTNQTSTPADNYFWDFGDGNSSTEENPTHSYEEEATYTVILTIGNICGTFSVTKSIDVFLPPTADFDVDTTYGCAPMMVTFANNSSSNADEFLWTFEGGTPETSTAENPTVTYDEAGTYDVVLKVSNDVGEDSLIKTSYITVIEFPTADFTASVDGLIVDFENMSTGYDTLMWDFGDGNISTQVEPSHTYEAEDIYEVTLTVINDCDTVTSVQSINLNTLPTAGFSTDVTEGCLPLTVMFTNNSSANTSSWEWNFPGGTPAMSTDANPTIVYTETGSFDVYLIVSNEMGADSVMSIGLITVSDVPTTDFEFSADDFNVNFTNLSGNYESISWDFGDGSASTEENPQHTYSEEGVYEVILSATNECGTVTESKNVTISTIPIADYSASSTEGCIPFTVIYSNNSSANVTEWEWSFPGGTPSTSTDENPTVTYSSTGVYDVSVIVNAAGGMDTLMMENYITTLDVPTANFNFSALTDFEYAFSNTSINADTYSWDFGDGNTSTEESPNHLFSEEGVYTVVLSATNDCGTETYEQEVAVFETSTIDGIDIFTAVNLNPNPNNGDFALSIEAIESGEIRMEIYNILGQQIKSDQFQLVTGQNRRAIRLENPASGAYLILLKKGNQSQMMKFIIH